MKPLHSYNRLRIDFLSSMVSQHFRNQPRPSANTASRRAEQVYDGNKASLRGLRILDVGCGGGILSVRLLGHRTYVTLMHDLYLLQEPLAAMGADVTGLDASERNIEIATEHARASALLSPGWLPSSVIVLTKQCACLRLRFLSDFCVGQRKTAREVLNQGRRCGIFTARRAIC